MLDFENSIIIDEWLLLTSKVSLLGYELNLASKNIIISFLPLEFWQKRGLILLLNHPNVTFVHLPDMPPEQINEPLTK
jgi:hypothetical protein